MALDLAFERLVGVCALFPGVRQKDIKVDASSEHTVVTFTPPQALVNNYEAFSLCMYRSGDKVNAHCEFLQIASGLQRLLKGGNVLFPLGSGSLSADEIQDEAFLKACFQATFDRAINRIQNPGQAGNLSLAGSDRGSLSIVSGDGDPPEGWLSLESQYDDG